MFSESIGARRRRLEKNRNLLGLQLQNIEGDADFDADFRAATCAKLRKEIKEIDAALARVDLQAILLVYGVVVSVVLWFGAAILCGHLFGGAVFAVMFWSGIGVAAIAGIAVWIRNKLESQDH